MADTQLRIRITADGKIAAAEIGRVEGAVKRLDPAAKSATGGVSGLSRELKLAAASAGVFAGAFAARQLAGFVQEVARAGDQVRILTLQATKLSGGTAGFQDLYQYAQRLGIGLADAGAQLNLFAPALGKLGKSFSDSVAFAEDLNKAMRVYGVTGQAAVSTTTQLAQALSSGTLAGDELKSLRENAGGLALELEKAIQSVLGTTESLKDLGSSGQLTAKVVADAWGIVFEGLRGDMESLPETLEQQEARMSNAATRLMGAIDDALHISDWWQGLTGGWADLLEDLANRLAGTIGGGLGVAAGQFSGRIEAINQAIAAAQERTQALGESMKSIFSIGSRDANQLEMEKLYGQMEALKREREQLIALAAEDLEITRAATAAEKSRTAAVQSTAKEIAKAGKLNPEFSANLNAMIAAASAEGVSLGITSGLRSTEEQAKLWADALVKYGSAEMARKWVAPPGSSLHEKGVAADLKATGDGYKWIADNVERFGLALPLANERWHVELAGARDTTKATKALGEAQKAQAAVAKESAKAAAALVRERESEDRAIAGLIRQYLPARAAAEDLAQAQALLAAAGERAGLSLEEQQRILAGVSGELDTLGEKIPTVGDLWVETVLNMAKSIQTTLGDAFYDLFSGTLKSAKDFMRALGDVILKSLSDIAAALVMRPINVVINGALGGTAAGLSGGASAGTAGLTGGTGSGSLLSSAGSLLSGNKLGAGISNVLGNGAWQLGLSSSVLDKGLLNLAGTSNLALGAGGILGGLAGNALFGGQGYGSIGSSIGSTAGAVIGSMILPGIGTIIGGLLGGIGGGGLGSLFGAEEKVPAAQVGVSGGTYHLQAAQDIKAADIAQIQAYIGQVNADIQAMAAALGVTPRTQIAGEALTPDGIQEYVTRTTGYVVQALIDDAAAGLGDVGSEYAKLVQQIAAANRGNVQAFADGVQALDAALSNVAAAFNAIQPGAIDNAEAAAALLASMGDAAAWITAGAGNLAALLDKLDPADSITDVDRAFADLGIAAPKSAAELRALVEGLDLTTESGLHVVGVLGNMTTALGEYITSQEAAAAALVQAAAAARQAFADMQTAGQAAWAAMARSAQAGLRQLIYTEQERKALAAREAAAEAKALIAGKHPSIAALDVTRLSQEQFAAAIKGLTRRSLSGEDALFAGLTGNTDAFVAAAARYYEAIKVEPPVVEKATRAVSSFKSAAADLTRTLLDWVDRTRSTTEALAESVRESYARSAFAAQYAKAKRGDQDAIAGLTGYADTYLGAALAGSANRVDYARISGRVTAAVESVATRKSYDPQLEQMQALREEAAAANTALISWQQKLVKLIDKWDRDGMPLERA